MKLTLLFVILLALILEVVSFGDQEHDSRHIPRKCKKKCKAGECCRIFWYWYKCFPQKGLGQPCRRNPPAFLCHHGCKPGLVCERSRRPGSKEERHPHNHKRFKCVRPPLPTQEPGSGDFYF
ncbi:uncharacterized protein LOC110067693 [Orbicella faveolata]|uniref:uncharacterized protein LOC110067693 n=1 Tax=Orbicella faveolata TaxID=48498 RepID=UPI0009E257ED|nr:uncharacterized protein LOC110067693 [Orbicella faveolata]